MGGIIGKAIRERWMNERIQGSAYPMKRKETSTSYESIAVGLVVTISILARYTSKGGGRSIIVAC